METNDAPSIRRLSTADALIYREIRLEGLRDRPEAFGSTFEREAAEEIAFFEDRLENSHVLAALIGESVVGVAALAFGTGKRAHIGLLWGMYVRPSARGQGIGRQLVRGILDIAKGRVEVVQLAVVSENETAVRLYLGAGFEQYGLEKKALNQDGRYYDEILMAIEVIR